MLSSHYEYKYSLQKEGSFTDIIYHVTPFQTEAINGLSTRLLTVVESKAH